MQDMEITTTANGAASDSPDDFTMDVDETTAPGKPRQAAEKAARHRALMQTATWRYIEDAVLLKLANPARENVRNVLGTNRNCQKLAVLPQIRNLQLNHGNRRLADLDPQRPERIAAMLMYITGHMLDRPCENTCGKTAGFFVGCVVASKSTDATYRGICANHLYHRNYTLCRLASKKERYPMYPADHDPQEHAGQPSFSDRGCIPATGLMEEELDDDDSSVAVAGPVEEEPIDSRNDAGPSAPPAAITSPTAQLGESDFYLCCSDPAEARELFHLLKTEVVAKLKTPYTLEIRLAGNPPEEEFHSRKVPQGHKTSRAQ